MEAGPVEEVGVAQGTGRWLAHRGSWEGLGGFIIFLGGIFLNIFLFKKFTLFNISLFLSVLDLFCCVRASPVAGSGVLFPSCDTRA